MFKKILITLVGVVILAALVGLVLPSDYEFEHAITIEAKPADIYQDVGTLETWVDWSAWNHDADKECKHEFPEPKTGEGAKWTWKGKPYPNGLGEGTMTVTKADPAVGIEFERTMVGMEPMTGSLKFRLENGVTTVTYKGSVGNDILLKYRHLPSMWNSTMKERYDKGLARLKERSEGRAAAAGKPVEAVGEKKK